MWDLACCGSACRITSQPVDLALLAHPWLAATPRPQEAYGLESMILSLALAQHSRLTHGGLDQADLAVGEALMLQHIGLLTDTVGPDAEDVAVARWVRVWVWVRVWALDGQVGRRRMHE